ncbi:MAG: PEP-CTERM sorting domain-containing protein [Planctomycetes bacterium]|nr:PEP-CTERM sorting domain-containing protein [Planctomycetota bacterium]MBU4400171.1 PEP-CTERM sorting domain-containing protein [Planctomycetota bacterium]MCG2682641.1 PEP-CTERM sorting domain-containing protein [Planctomycetales bacterium]
MFFAKKSLVVLAVLGTLMFPAAPAVAHWYEGDGHKMHFPQLPDPNGWDVGWSDSWLGDDWRCSETGPVTDIHLWVSFKEWSDIDVPAPMFAAPISVQIWSNDPGGAGATYPYSTPLDLLWEGNFEPSDYTVRYAGSGHQGWYWPATGTEIPYDHDSYFQINIDKIMEPFYQEEGEVYWLVTKMFVEGPNPIGWKTADLDRYPDPFNGEHFMDDAVHYYEGWNEIYFEGASRDLAFVITPEPGTLVLLATAGLGLLLFAWRRRK